MEPTSSIAATLARIGAIAAPVGAVILTVSTLLHPVKADPDDALAAFAEYAADPLWVWSHLGQFVGVAVLGIALIGLAGTLEVGRAAAWARISLAGRQSYFWSCSSGGSCGECYKAGEKVIGIRQLS